MIKQSRREFVKKAAYIQPVILTWPLRPRTQRQGLIKSIPDRTQSALHTLCFPLPGL